MPDVYVLQGGDPAQMAYDAISRVFHEDPAELSVLLKVNTGFKGPAASGLCTHPEVVRGLIRYFKARSVKKLYVGDSSIVGVDSVEALKSAGIWGVCEEEGVECLNLDDSGMHVQEIPDPVMVSQLKMSNLPFEVDRVISVPVIKTHMYATVTLGIKNMKGCLYQKDKTRLHRINQAPPDIHKGKCLDYGIADLMKVCYPDYVVTDGVVAMEGFGPSGGTPVNLGVVLASDDALSADLTAVQLMGMATDSVPHLNLMREQRGLALVRLLAKRLHLPVRREKAGLLACELHMKAGLYDRLRPGTRRDVLWTVATRGLMKEFWSVVDADSKQDISSKALEDTALLRTIGLPPQWQNKGAESARKLRELHCQALVGSRSA